MRMDCVGSGAGKACRPINRCGGSLIWEIHKELGLVGVAPPVSHRRALRTFLPPMPPFTTKGIFVWAQGGSGWSVQPSWLSRVLSRWWVSQSNKSCIFFINLLSSLASSIKSQLLETLMGSSTKVDDGFGGPASSFCNFLQPLGVAWVIKCMANIVLPSVDSVYIGVLPECLCHPTQEDCQVFNFFLYNLSDLIIIYRLSHIPFHFFWKTSNVMSHPSLAYTIFIVPMWPMWVASLLPDEFGSVDGWPVDFFLCIPWPFSVYTPFHPECNSGPE